MASCGRFTVSIWWCSTSLELRRIIMEQRLCQVLLHSASVSNLTDTLVAQSSQVLKSCTNVCQNTAVDSQQHNEARGFGMRLFTFRCLYSLSAGALQVKPTKSWRRELGEHRNMPSSPASSACQRQKTQSWGFPTSGACWVLMDWTGTPSLPIKNW